MSDIADSKQLPLDIFNALPVPALVMDIRATVRQWNLEAKQLLGWSANEVLGRAIPGLSDDERAKLNGRLTRLKWAGGGVSERMAWMRKDGRVLQIDAHISSTTSPGGVCHVIAVLIEAEAPLRLLTTRDAKLTAVARLAGVVAHDINNILINIGNLASLLSNADASMRINEVRRNADWITEQTRRAALITSVLRDYGGRRKSSAAGLVNVNRLLQRLAGKFRRLLGNRITLTLVLSVEDLMVAADPQELDRVLVFFLDNAREAIKEEGTVTIQTASAYDIADLGPRKPKSCSYATISVADTGPGIGEPTLSHLFEPFFTTKKIQAGTSLSLAYSIIKAWNGQIEAKNVPGQGALFTIYLPQGSGEVRQQEIPEDEAERFVGNETIVLVEDDAGVRHLIATQLRALGYIVLEASGPEEALALGLRDSPVQLLLTDVVMPGSTGGALSKLLTASRPALKTLFISGYPDANLRGESLLESGVEFIQKPFTTGALARKIRQVLDAV